MNNTPSPTPSQKVYGDTAGSQPADSTGLISTASSTEAAPHRSIDSPTDSPIHSAIHRPIRSYVTRAGRISVAQQRALDTLWPRFGLEFAPQPVDFIQVFGREAPCVLEIGFGMGETTAIIAAACPHINFLGIEVHTPGVGALLKLAGETALQNLRILSHDAVEVLDRMIPPDSLAGVHIFFPDPWHKARHHKRRLIQPPFVQRLATRLVPGGYLHCATDWENYAEQMLQVLTAEPLLENTTMDYAQRTNPIVERPATKFERRGLRLGHAVRDLIFTRKSAAALK